MLIADDSKLDNSVWTFVIGLTQFVALGVFPWPEYPCVDSVLKIKASLALKVPFVIVFHLNVSQHWIWAKFEILGLSTFRRLDVLSVNSVSLIQGTLPPFQDAPRHCVTVRSSTEFAGSLVILSFLAFNSSGVLARFEPLPERIPAPISSSSASSQATNNLNSSSVSWGKFCHCA